MAFNLAKCDQCGDCFVACKYTEYDRDGAVAQIQKLIRGEQAEILTECVTCVACNTYCEKGANPFDLILRYQEKFGVYKTTESYYQLVENIDKSPGEIEPGDLGKPVFNICAVDVIPHLFEGQLFEGATFLRGGAYESVLGGIHVGEETYLRDHLQEKIDALAETGYDEIIMFHDDCYGAYTTKAMEYNIDVPFEVKHYVEYLVEYVKAYPDAVQPLDMKVAYQQPCSSRYTPWIDEAIDELFALIGVERVTREYDRRDALCCSSPVAPHLGHEAGEANKARNLQDALEHDAAALVFMCPFCALQMRDEAHEAGLEPIFLTNLVRMALGESLPTQAAGVGDDRAPIVGAVQIVKGLM